MTQSSAVLFAICLALSPVAFAQTSGGTTATLLAGPHRPANVPKNYVITPFGYFHPSCVQRLGKGDRLLVDRRVQHSDGAVESSAAVCSYPHFTPTGLPVTMAATTLPEVDGWVENANITTGSESNSYGALIATWFVPPHPIVDDGQVLFFFPGLEDISNTQSILQPVLQWFQGQWAIASWNCCLNDITTESPLVNVRPGDLIYGSITNTCPPGTASCATWNVLAVDLFTGESTALSDTPSEGQVFNWAFGGVLESYSVISCADYPPNRRIRFDNVTVFDGRLHPIQKPMWAEANSPAQPQCNYTVKAAGREVRLTY